MKITTPIALVLATLGILASILLFYVSFAPVETHANSVTATAIGTATTSASIAVTTSTRLLATTTSITGTSYTRVYATICTAASNPVYLNLDGDKPAGVGNVTAIIAAAAGYSACYEVTDRNLYQGSITASSTNQTSTTVNVKDYVQ